MLKSLPKQRHTIFAGVFLLACLMIIFSINSDPNSKFKDFVTLFLGIIVGAFPFIVLGVTISTLVTMFMNRELLLRWQPRNRFLNHIYISLLGSFMPVCECGNVAVARSMIDRGLSVSQSMTFLLAAPIINPITIYSTYEAFQFEPIVLVVRLIAAFLIANFLGILISYHPHQEALLNEDFLAECEVHDHHHESRLQEFTSHFGHEFITMMRSLVIGASIAALSQILMPRDLITAIGSSPVLSVIAMIVLAFVISICSSIDAFFALSYASTFSIGALISFLIFGPMIDIKMLSMMLTTYSRKLVLFVSIFVTLASLMIGLLVNYIY